MNCFNFIIVAVGKKKKNITKEKSWSVKHALFVLILMFITTVNFNLNF